MIRKVILLLTCILVSITAFPISLSASNKLDNGTSIYDTSCNKDTQIDFYFSSDSLLKDTGVTVASKSTLRFLDVLGEDLELTLKSGSIANQNLVTEYDALTSLYFYFEFETEDGKKQVDILIPFI